jgi:hypothetical protein
MASKRNAALEAMIAEATVDAYNDDEQLTGLFTMIEDGRRLNGSRTDEHQPASDAAHGRRHVRAGLGGLGIAVV